MSGGDVVRGGFERPRRNLIVPQLMAADAIQDEDKSLLALLSAKHRITNSGLRFNKLAIGERKKFYQ